MMRIKIAKTAGFCMGVRRAVGLALDASEDQTTLVHTFGPLIHNPQVLDLFSKRRIAVLEDIPKKGYGTAIIRAHGVPPIVEAQLLTSGFEVVDATCPRVARVQAIIKSYSDKGYEIIIVGDKNHPEVVGLVGYSRSDANIVRNMAELEKLSIFEKAIVVAQTTQDVLFYKKVKKWVAANNPHYNVFNTICDSTEKRQIETKLLANRVDVVIVVGGKQSGNTKRLKEIAERSDKPVFHIETEADLFSYDPFSLTGKVIGITAGASTPNWIIRKVYDAVNLIILKNLS